MSSYKRILGDYNIVSVQPQFGDNVNVVTHSVNITGNLNVAGNITYIDVSELVVNDPFITVAGNNAGAGAGATFPQQGLVAQTGNTGTPTFAGLRFNNDTISWQISSNVTAAGAAIDAYSDIALAGASDPGQPANSIQFNIGNVFTGNTNFTFDYSVSQVSLDGAIALKHQASSAARPRAHARVGKGDAASGVGHPNAGAWRQCVECVPDSVADEQLTIRRYGRHARAAIGRLDGVLVFPNNCVQPVEEPKPLRRH